MYGYDHIKSTFMPSAQVTAGGYNKEQKGELALKRTLCTMGAYECMHYSFFSPSDLDLLKFPADAKERFRNSDHESNQYRSVINAYYTCCINAQCYFKK